MAQPNRVQEVDVGRLPDDILSIRKKEYPRNTKPTIKCKKCGNTFEPDMKTTKTWTCPSCEARNPNLKRHYRSVANLFILNLFASPIFVAIRVSEAGQNLIRFSEGVLNLGVMLWAADEVLLLVTIVFVYKSKTPWSDNVAKTLIWSVFGLALLFNFVIPLVLAGALNIPFIIVFAVVFPYVFWLSSQARKCTVSGCR